MTRGARLIGNAGIYALAGAISACVPLLLLPILTRLLTPTEYGTVAMFALVVTVVGAFTGLSVQGAVAVRYFQQDRVQLPRYVTSCLVLLGFSGLVTLAIVWSSMPTLEAFTKVPGDWLLIAVLVSCAQFVIQVRLNLWQSAGKPWPFALARTGQAAVDLALSLLFVLVLGFVWEGRLASLTLAAGIFTVVGGVSLMRSGLLAWPPGRAEAADALRFGLPLIPHTIGGMLVSMADRFLISNLLDVASTGVYVVGMQVGMALGLVTDSFNRAFAPWLMESLKSPDPARDRLIVRRTYLYFVVVIAVALGFGAVAPALLSWLVGPKYQAAAPVVFYIAIGFAFAGMYYMVTNYVFFAGRTAGLALITFGSGIFNVALTYHLLLRNGVVGAAQGFMVSQAVTFLGTWWLAHRARPMPWWRFADPA